MKTCWVSSEEGKIAACWGGGAMKSTPRFLGGNSHTLTPQGKAFPPRPFPELTILLGYEIVVCTPN